MTDMDNATTRHLFFVERVAIYRGHGYDLADSTAMARMDTNEKFGKLKVRLKSRKIGY